jgi:hypothetical protein
LLNKKAPYYQFITQLTFVVTLLLISMNPIMDLIDHINKNDIDIELVEDFDKEDTETECDENLIFSINSNIFSILLFNNISTSTYILNQYMKIYCDILIRPPKQII